MTLLHFINCMALAYAPYFITYRFSGLSEYSAFWRCVKAGGAYFVTQLCKMLVLATFFPVMEVDEDNITMTAESAHCMVDLIDLLGIYIVLTKVMGRGEMKVLTAAIGWGTAELLATRVLPLWFGARGVEFNWKYIQSGLDSNISLVFLITATSLLWLWNRNDLNRSLLPLIALMLVAITYKPFLFHLLRASLGLGPWMVLLAKALMACGMGLVALQLYAGMIAV